MSSIDETLHLEPPEFLSLTIADFIEPPAFLYEKVYQALPGTFLFESGTPGALNQNISIMGAFSGLSLKFFENRTEIERNGHTTVYENDSPETLLDAFIKNTFTPTSFHAPLHGGLVGYFGYDSLIYFEDVRLRTEKRRDTPLGYLGLTDEIIVINHIKSEIEIFVSVFERKEIAAKAERLKSIKKQIVSPLFPLVDKSFSARNPASGLTREEFSSIVDRVRTYIYNGDIFQANISQQFSAKFSGSAWGLYLVLREINPSPFQGYMDFGDLKLVSGSPERLIKIDSGKIETRPIAGTRRRGKDPEEDLKLSRDLLLNKKERAEHIMLVDLERNDLGRVCKYGSVRVGEFMGLEPYSHVWHIVSGVTGQLKDNTSLTDVLGACFPGGTITGCPKVRCVEIIEELENVSRGIYTGSMGYLGWGGKVDLNILIRSAVIMNGEVRFSGGAGIVADSVPEAEYVETLNKVRAIMEALGLPQW